MMNYYLFLPGSKTTTVAPDVGPNVKTETVKVLVWKAHHSFFRNLIPSLREYVMRDRWDVVCDHSPAICQFLRMVRVTHNVPTITHNVITWQKLRRKQYDLKITSVDINSRHTRCKNIAKQIYYVTRATGPLQKNYSPIEGFVWERCLLEKKIGRKKKDWWPRFLISLNNVKPSPH